MYIYVITLLYFNRGQSPEEAELHFLDNAKKLALYGVYIVIYYINLFVFEDEIEMKNRSTIQTLTFVHTNPDHLYMKLVVVHANIQFRFEKIGRIITYYERYSRLSGFGCLVHVDCSWI
jgi:hypothetical protein